MQTKPYHILRMDRLGTPIWVEAVASLAIAKTRVAKLGEISSGEYVIFHSPTSRIVANIRNQNVRNQGGLAAK